MSSFCDYRLLLMLLPGQLPADCQAAIGITYLLIAIAAWQHQ